MSELVPVVLNALTLISILALVALGLAIIFGMMDVINLAHGEMITVGAYTLALIQKLTGAEPTSWAYWAALALAPAVGALLGLLIESTVIRRLYHYPLETILATFGLSLILQKAIELAFSAQPQIVYSPIRTTVAVFGVDYPGYRLFVIAVAAGLIAACLYVFARTRFGLDLKAVIQNRAMAEAVGIDTKRTSRIAFAAGSALAAVAGVLVAPLASIEATLGTFYLGKAFFVVIIGGIGSITGTLAGSVLVGGIETLLNYRIDPSAASALVLLAAVVLVRLRPQGLVPGYSAAHELLGKK